MKETTQNTAVAPTHSCLNQPCNSGLDELLLTIKQLFNVNIAQINLTEQYQALYTDLQYCGHNTVLLPPALLQHITNQDTPVITNNLITDMATYTSSHRSTLADLRFYAGIPLQQAHQTIGVFSLIDHQALELSAQQLHSLIQLSQHLAEYLLLQQERKLLEQEHSLLDNSPAVLIKWHNKNGLRLTYISRNIQTLFGLPFGSLNNNQTAFECFIVPSSMQEFSALLDNHQKGVELAEAHFQLKSPKDKLFWVKLLSKAFFSADGKLDTIHALLIDHTSNRYIEQKLTTANQQLRLLLEASALGTWDWNIPNDVNKVNQRWCDMLGIEHEYFDASYQFWRMLIHPADLKRLEAELTQHLRGETQVFNTIYRMRHSDGYWLWIESYGKVVERNIDGKAVRLAGTHRDITYKKEAELLETKQRQLLSFINKAQAAYLEDYDLSKACREILPELIDIADSQFAFIGQTRIVDGQQQLYIHAISEMSWNEQSSHLVALYKKGQLYFKQFDNLFGRVITSKRMVISNDPPSHDASKGTPAGHPTIFRFLGLPITLKGELVGMIGLANKSSDYTEQDASFLQPLLDALGSLYYAVQLEQARFHAEEKLKNLAMTDPLTGIANRRALIERCTQINNSHSHYVLAIADIDHFKNINDTYGHGAGDDVLKCVACAIRDQLRSDDYVARLGGEEFAIVIQNSNQHDATALLETIRQQIGAMVTITHDHPLTVTISIGAHYIPKATHTELTTYLSNADQALYQAKQQGRNCLRWSIP